MNDQSQNEKCLVTKTAGSALRRVVDCQRYCAATQRETSIYSRDSHLVHIQNRRILPSFGPNVYGFNARTIEHPRAHLRSSVHLSISAVRPHPTQQQQRQEALRSRCRTVSAARRRQNLVLSLLKRCVVVIHALLQQYP